MNYREEIEYRNEILARVRNGEKVTSMEQQWLLTHRIYNRSMGYPYLNTDIIQLQPNINYCVRIKVESMTFDRRILPVITVPGGRGKIVANSLCSYSNDNVKSKKIVKMLGILIDKTHKETEITYQSDLGVLGVSFECEYFDEKQQLIIRKNSNVGDPNFAMFSETLANNKMIYQCKPPMEKDFESFIFSIEWNPIT